MKKPDGLNCRLQVAGCRSGFHLNVEGIVQDFLFCFVEICIVVNRTRANGPSPRLQIYYRSGLKSHVLAKQERKCFAIVVS